MAQACIAAIQAQSLEVIYYGVIPTPALAYSAMQDEIPCIMVIGSHIPFDRNGLKFYRPDGEITKIDEQAILAAEISFEIESSLPKLIASSRAAEQYVERLQACLHLNCLKGNVSVYMNIQALVVIYIKAYFKQGNRMKVVDM